MRPHRTVLGVALVLGTGAAVSNAALGQENRGTMEQQMACTPDVWRLCSDQIPDVNRIVACLRQNTPQLSSSCRAVFASNNSGPQSQQVPPRGYAVAPPPPPRGRMMPRPDEDDDDQ